jgi:hypothetical protein
MRLILAALLLLLAGGPAGCRERAPAAAQACPGPGVKAFAEPCAGDCECASGVCYRFRDGRACSRRCTDASGCPPGSRGAKCNNQGVCRI